MESTDVQPQLRTIKRVKPISKSSTISDDTRCMARMTHDHSAQHFGNGRNKFYLEFRCPLPRFRDMDVCVRCLEKKPKGQQDSRSYDHGKINEPIPDHSHIFGGVWYHAHVAKWGEPEVAAVSFALEHQREARGNYDAMISKVDFPYQEEMGRPKKELVAATAATSTTTEPAPPVKAKPGRKPKQATAVEEEKKAEPKTKKRTAPRKKAEATPYQSLASEQRLIYKEVTLPTHMEQTMEEIDLDDYEVEYITLTPIEIGQTTYYIDRSSQKVFKRIRDKQMGEYMGRYDPATESIHTDIPDSDDESDE